ncbi:MAG: hypothetical protein JST86_13900 [Bacteroidetes bacterium]|nr:hypothetical protein [Bacteroidota bacterium]
MKHTAIFLAFALAIVSCSNSKKTTTATPVETTAAAATGTENGLSYDNAVVINEKNETAGVHAEYEWLKKNYPGYQVKSQALSTHNGKPYDILNIVTADGAEKKIYFNISKFFGKF